MRLWTVSWNVVLFCRGQFSYRNCLKLRKLLLVLVRQYHTLPHLTHLDEIWFLSTEGLFSPQGVTPLFAVSRDWLTSHFGTWKTRIPLSRIVRRVLRQTLCSHFLLLQGNQWERSWRKLKRIASSMLWFLQTRILQQRIKTLSRNPPLCHLLYEYISLRKIPFPLWY